MKRAALGVALAVLIWSVQDAIIWRHWFDGRPWTTSADLYQFWHQATLTLLVILGMAWIRGPLSIWFAVSTWVIANSGFADVLYYWLALQPIPQTLPWLDVTHPLVLFHPATDATVVASSALWIWFLTATGLVMRLVMMRR